MSPVDSFNYGQRETSGHVTVCCKDHNRLLADGLKKLLQEDYLVDANVIFRGTCFKVHRLILAVFLPSVKEHMSNVTSGGCPAAAAAAPHVLSMDNVASESGDVRVLLEFLYSGKVTVRRERIREVCQLAKDLNLECFAEAIDEWVRNEGSADNLGESAASDEATSSTFASSSVDTNEPHVGQDLADGNAVQMLVIGDVKQGVNLEEPLEDCGDSVRTEADASNERDLSESLERSTALGTTVVIGRRGRNSLLERVEHKNVSEGEEKSCSKLEECSNDSEWLPEDSANCKLRKTVGRAVPSRADTSRSEAPVTSSDFVDPKENDVIDRFCQQVLQTSEAVRDMFKSDKLDECRVVTTEGPSSCKRSRKSADVSPAAADLPPKCDKCNRKFLTLRYLRIHLKKGCGQPLERVCQPVFQTSEEVRDVSKSDKPDECRVVTTEGRSSRKRSRKSTTADVSPAAADLPPTCDKCSRKFLTLRYLRIHLKKGCGMQPVEHVCDECGYRAKDQLVLERHMQLAHKKYASPSLLWRCSECEYVTTTKPNLRRHVAWRHTIEREHKCPECQYSAMFKNELVRHVSRIHRKDKKFMCEMCGACFHVRSKLNMHLLVKHQGVKPYKCGHCGKEYKDYNSCNIHEKTKHSLNVERHVCDLCGNSYIKRWGLQYHMRHAHGTCLEPLRKPYGPRNPTAEVQDS